MTFAPVPGLSHPIPERVLFSQSAHAGSHQLNVDRSSERKFLAFRQLQAQGVASAGAERAA
jgi:hypothetical protein